MPTSRRQTTLDEDLSRVGGGITAAAAFLTAARSARFVPRYDERLAEGQVPTGARFMQTGLHMMGIVALCAVLEQSRNRDLVNLPSFLRRLDDAAERQRLATRLKMDSAVLYLRIAKIKERFESRIEPMIDEVKSMRDRALAHHGQGPITATTYGRISRLAERTIVLVEEIYSLIQGIRPNHRLTVQAVRWQSAAIWARGIEGRREDQMISSVGETD